MSKIKYCGELDKINNGYSTLSGDLVWFIGKTAKEVIEVKGRKAFEYQFSCK